MYQKTVTKGRVSRVQVVKPITQRDKCHYQLVQVQVYKSDANFDSIIRFLAEIRWKLAVFVIFSFFCNDYEISWMEALPDIKFASFKYLISVYHSLSLFLAHLSTTCSRGAFRVVRCPSSDFNIFSSQTAGPIWTKRGRNVP